MNIDFLLIQGNTVKIDLVQSNSLVNRRMADVVFNPKIKKKIKFLRLRPVGLWIHEKDVSAPSVYNKYL